MSKKSTFFITLGLAGVLLVLTGCGLKQSNPLAAYKSLNTIPEGQTLDVVDLGHPYPQIDDQIGRLVQQQSTFRVSTNESLSFFEGQNEEYELTVQFLIGKVQFDVEVVNAPAQGFSLQLLSKEENRSRYKVSWTPSAGTIAQERFSLLGSLQIKLSNVEYVSSDSAENERARRAYDSLLKKEAQVAYVVRKDNQIPTLVVNHLSGDRKAGEVHEFSVDVTVPASYSGHELTPEVSFDMSSLINDLDLVEMNGAHFVSVNPNKAIEKLANNKWRVHYVFDTQNQAIMPQYDRTLNVLEGADKVLVNVAFQINNPEYVAISEKTVLKFYINLN